MKLNAADQTAECTATVAADPRVQAKPEDYRLQAEMLGKIRVTLGDIHTTVNQYRQVKSQVTARLSAIRKMAATEELVQQGQAINKQLNAWEQQLIQPSQKTFQDVINFPNRLNAQLVFLAGQLDTNDPQTTQGCRDRLAELVKQWETPKIGTAGDRQRADRPVQPGVPGPGSTRPDHPGFKRPIRLMLVVVVFLLTSTLSAGCTKPNLTPFKRTARGQVLWGTA